MNQRSGLPASPEPALPIQAFLQAAEQGGHPGPHFVWVERTDGGDAVRSGAQAPATGRSDSTLSLFAAALHQRYGAQAAALALRGLPQTRAARAGLLEAQAVRRAIARAESHQALHDAQALMWQLEFSAVMLGRRFVEVCEGCAIDARRLPLARREAIDAAMGWAGSGALQAPASGGLDAGGIAERLRGLLLQPLH